VDWRIVAGLIGINTLFLFSYRQLDYVASGLHRPALLTLAEEVVGGLAGLAIFPLLYLVAIRFPLISPRWRLFLAIHLAAICLISIVHTTLIALFRLTMLPAFGFPHVSYGSLPMRYPMEFSHLFIYYWFGVTGVYLYHEIRYAREREVQQATLERDLAEAQLQNLRLQLEPHFLFNTLNAISAAIYEDARVADEMIGRLADLLRRLLKEDRSPMISLSREVELLQLYTHIMQARLEDRLVVRIDIAPGVKNALVPQLILQPLVENSIRHGMNLDFKATIDIQARQEGGLLHLSVRDYGSGLDDSSPLKMGIGLRNISERLEKLYGPRQSFALRNAAAGGATADIRLPLQVSQA
jgi:signal transduction histidine kinase